MAQFDVHRNTSKKTATEFPYLLEVQSDLFSDSTRAVVIPLVLASTLGNKDSMLNPEFDVESSSVALFPLDIASMNVNFLGDTVANISADSDRIIAALDLLLARF
ncbi:MAG: CcdB family protein [Granulosicoccaceae bacterium]